MKLGRATYHAAVDNGKRQVAGAGPVRYLFHTKTTKKVSIMQKITTGGVEVPKLRSYIERIERLEEDKAGVASDIKDVFAEAKSNGFDIKAMRGVLKLRKMKSNERSEQEYMLDLYKRALGMDVTMDEDAEEAA